MIGVSGLMVISRVSAASVPKSCFMALRSTLLPLPLSPVMSTMSPWWILRLVLSKMVNFCVWSVPSPNASATSRVRWVWVFAGGFVLYVEGECVGLSVVGAFEFGDAEVFGFAVCHRVSPFVLCRWSFCLSAASLVLPARFAIIQSFGVAGSVLAA